MLKRIAREIHVFWLGKEPMTYADMPITTVILLCGLAAFIAWSMAGT